MLTNKRFFLGFSALVFLGGFVLGGVLQPWSVLRAQSSQRVFEIRTYTAPDGKLDALHARFRDHTLRIFQKHGMTSVAYFKPQDAPLSQNTLMYILAHQSREAAKKSWADFQADPEWQKVAADSQVNGRIVSNVVSVFADPTDYSPLK
jgi:NIPSNAP